MGRLAALTLGTLGVISVLAAGMAYAHLPLGFWNVSRYDLQAGPEARIRRTAQLPVALLEVGFSLASLWLIRQLMVMRTAM